MQDLLKQMENWILTRQLMNVSVVQKSKGQKHFHGRILQFNPDEMLILFYHDDEKKVYNITLNEIEDIQPANNTRAKTEKNNTDSKEKIKILEAIEEKQRATAQEQLVKVENTEKTKKLEKTERTAEKNQELPSIKAEAIQIITHLDIKEVEVILPLLKHLAQGNR